MAGTDEGTNSEKILEALDGAPEGLDEDSLMAVLALTNSIEFDQCLVDLLKERKIIAKYKGDKTEIVDPDLFVYCKVKDEKNKTGE